MKEHAIGTDGRPIEDKPRGNVSSLFDENEKGQFIPRAIFVDTDSMVIEEAMKTDVGQLLESDQFIYGKEPAITYWRGRFTVGNEITQILIDNILKIIEKCANFESVLIFHSISGGSGSGLFWNIVETLTYKLPKLITISFTIMPSNDYSSDIIEPYNFIFSTYWFVQFWTLNIWYDNQTLYKIWESQLKIEAPNFYDINELIQLQFFHHYHSFYLITKSIFIDKCLFNLNFGISYQII